MHITLSWETLLQYIGNIISFIVALSILSGKKESRATLSWLLIVIFLPYIGAILYIFFGIPRLKKMVDVKLKSDVNLDIYKYYNELEEFNNSVRGHSITSVTGCKPQLCSNLELLTNAEEKYLKLREDISGAKHYIFFEYYVFRQDETGKFFINLLTEKAKEGVKIYFIYDGIGAMGLSLKNTLKPLEKAGGKTGVFLSLFSLKTVSKLNFRNHRKIVIIDGKICYTGGINIGDEYVGRTSKSGKWHDIHIKFSGDAVYSVAEIFAKDWYFVNNERLDNLIKEYEKERGGDTTIQVVSSGPDQKTPLIYNALLTAISMAKEKIDIITPYLIPDQPLVELLKNLSMRGIKIRLILPGKSNHPLVAAAGKSYYEELMEAGVEIYETKNSMLHAKIVIIDGYWCTVGSTNMDTRSFRLNFELDIVVYSKSFSKKINILIENYLMLSTKKDYEHFAKRNYILRLFEGICRALSPVM